MDRSSESKKSPNKGKNKEANKKKTHKSLPPIVSQARTSVDKIQIMMHKLLELYTHHQHNYPLIRDKVNNWFEWKASISLGVEDNRTSIESPQKWLVPEAVDSYTLFAKYNNFQGVQKYVNRFSRDIHPVISVRKSSFPDAGWGVFAENTIRKNL